MVQYDSSIDTLAHINVVSENIDRVCDNLLKPTCCFSDLEDATLVDLAKHFRVYKSDDETVSSLITNTFNDYDLKGQILTIDDIVEELQKRKNEHDKSKLKEPEKSGFDIWTPHLRASSIGSEEYKMFLYELRNELAHHYSIYRHHPEHFPNGIRGMNVIDIIELFEDWKASTKRQDNGNIYDSIEYLKGRFNYGPGLVKIFTNTANKY